MKRTASVFVEVLAVLFVVGLFAVVAIPDNQRQSPQQQQQQTLITAMERVRTALDQYWGDHDARFPTLQEVQDLATGSRAPKLRSQIGAYLGSVPANPFSNGNVVAPAGTPLGQSDWVYDETTGVFKANDNVEHRAL